jgi:hypothetical protein
LARTSFSEDAKQIHFQNAKKEIKADRISQKNTTRIIFLSEEAAC